MDIDAIFNTDFHKGVKAVEKEISTWNLKQIKRFPYT